MSRTRTNLLFALGATLIGLAAVPAASHAATLGPATIDGTDYVRYVASPGEVNRLDVHPGPAGTVAFVDPGATITPQAPTCTSVSAHEARCASILVPAVAVSLGDRDDRVTVSVDLPGLLSGDAGDDTLTGGDGDESLRGGDGNDTLDGRGGADVMAGENGVDTVSYASRTAAVSVDLSTVALGAEGQAGEHDTVASDVEHAIGGAGDDTLTGDSSANLLDGGAGKDIIDGGAGDDTLAGGSGNDAVDGGAGNDAADGGDGDDRVTGGSGADDLHGGAGADTLRGRDGTVDNLDCGGDADVVDADDNDTVSGCESGAPVLPPVPTKPLTVPFSFIFGSVKLPDQPVALQHGHVTLNISCPAATPSGRCAGVISLERFAKKSKKAHSSRRTRRFRVADQAYSVKAGKKAKVRVRISSLGRRAINRNGSLKVKVYLRRTKRAKKATKIGTLKVHASRRTKRRHVKTAA
jgi:RTX calcium-binding nonapeptide repeat (4 copies)